MIIIDSFGTVHWLPETRDVNNGVHFYHTQWNVILIVHYQTEQLNLNKDISDKMSRLFAFT